MVICMLIYCKQQRYATILETFRVFADFLVGNVSSDGTNKDRVVQLAATEFVSKPRITSHTGDHATEGGKLELNCTVEIHVGVTFTMEWDLPNDNIAKEVSLNKPLPYKPFLILMPCIRLLLQENRAEIEKPIKELSTVDSTLQIGRSRLIVNNINRAKDQGLYVCKVRDHNNKSNSNNKVITILGKNSIN